MHITPLERVVRKATHASVRTAYVVRLCSLAAALAILVLISHGGTLLGVGLVLGGLYAWALTHTMHKRMEDVHYGLVREALHTPPPTTEGLRSPCPRCRARAHTGSPCTTHTKAMCSGCGARTMDECKYLASCF